MTHKLTHKDIYTKFMIEYDKANVTSSYPSLTEYEVATLLDKAYQALIAQKFTGNNARRVPFEYDEKAIADLAPLVRHKDIKLSTSRYGNATNIVQYDLPEDMMYYVSSALNQFVDNPMDKDHVRLVPIKLVNHALAEKFFNTPYNMPWVKIPVSFIEDNDAFVVYDPVNKPNVDAEQDAVSLVHLSYIGKPESFVANLIDIVEDNPTQEDPEVDQPIYPDDPTPEDPQVPAESDFRLNTSELNGNDKIR